MRQIFYTAYIYVNRALRVLQIWKQRLTGKCTYAQVTAHMPRDWRHALICCKSHSSAGAVSFNKTRSTVIYHLKATWILDTTWNQDWSGSTLSCSEPPSLVSTFTHLSWCLMVDQWSYSMIIIISSLLILKVHSIIKVKFRPHFSGDQTLIWSDWN